jgi:hypothetical protein
MIDADHPGPYTDTPAPKVFGNVSPLDPQLFSRINDFADELLKGESSGKYSPVEVAQWIEDLAAKALEGLARAGTAKDTPEYRRAMVDIVIQAGLGRFFGAKFRSAVLYRIYERTGNRTALEEALKAYRAARASWAELANRAKGVYVSDITVGEHPQLRGHWMDRLPAIDADIALMANQPDRVQSLHGSQARAEFAIKAALGTPRRDSVACEHRPAEKFRPGQPLNIELSAAKPVSARLYYRHITQAERFESAEMRLSEGLYRATIPPAYTSSPYPLEYYFELRQGPESAWLYPGFRADLTGQPYFVVRRA